MASNGGFFFQPNSTATEADPIYDEYGVPQPQPRYRFMRRVNRLDWNFLDKIDVIAISRNGDVDSVEYLMGFLALANITGEDVDKFGSRGALNAFLLLQMAVEILMNKIQYYTQNKPPQAPANEPTPQHEPNYTEAQIEMLQNDIRSRDIMISSLNEKLRAAQEELQRYKKMMGETPTLSQTTHTVNPREQTEGPTLHNETEIKNYFQAQAAEAQEQKKVRRKKKKKHHHHQEEDTQIKDQDLFPMGWDENSDTWN